MDDIRMGMLAEPCGSAETEVLRALCGGQRIIHAGDGDTGGRNLEKRILVLRPGKRGAEAIQVSGQLRIPQLSGKMFETTVTVPGTCTGSKPARDARREEGGRGPAWICSRGGQGKTACQ